MKKIPILFILVAVLFTACFKTEIAPPLMFDGEANMSIADFQKLHTLNAEKPVTLIEDEIIIKGIVTSTDKYGSCYKEIYFQDETGGLCIRINNSLYHNKYRIGQQIFVKAKGLYLGNYVSISASGVGRYGFYQLGLYGNSNGGMEYISAKKENQHIFRHDFPGKRPEPKIITSASHIDTEIGGNYHTLVTLTNCHFKNADGTRKYFEPSGTLSTTSQDIEFNSGTGTVQARISQYCTFANDLLPQGALNITGILTMYLSPPYTPHQLIICNIDDVFIIPPAKILKIYDMNKDPFTEGWTNKQMKGTTKWIYYSDSKSVRIQEANAKETECWFVSPKLDFAGEKNLAISFNYRLLSGTSENVEVSYTVDGTNWNSLDFTPQTGVTNDAVVKLPETISTNPNLQIAFQYKTTSTFPIWIINSITFMANVY
jgi:hypothetical protein